jgi:hypothetical protein
VLAALTLIAVAVLSAVLAAILADTSGAVALNWATWISAFLAIAALFIASGRLLLALT